MSGFSFWTEKNKRLNLSVWIADVQKPCRLSLTGNTVINIACLIPKWHSPFQKMWLFKENMIAGFNIIHVIRYHKPSPQKILKLQRVLSSVFFFKYSANGRSFSKMDTLHFGKKAFICQYFSGNPCATERGIENSASGSGRPALTRNVNWRYESAGQEPCQLHSCKQ